MKGRDLERQKVIDEITDLYEKKKHHMMLRVQRRVGGMVNAEDVVQDAFCNAIQYAGGWDGRKPIDRWFSTILNNAARDFKRQERLDGMVDEPELTDSADNVRFKSELVESLLGEIEELEEDNREALRAFLIFGWKATEIAKWSPLTANNIRVLVHRFRKDMQEKYGEDISI
jgi:RNA polymerase sigma factor (sigma-70 family)